MTVNANDNFHGYVVTCTVDANAKYKKLLFKSSRDKLSSFYRSVRDKSSCKSCQAA